MDMTYDEMLREMEAYRAASAQPPAVHERTRHEEMLERLCAGAGQPGENDALLAVLRKLFTAEEAETWLLCPAFSKEASPMLYDELRGRSRPEMQDRLDRITEKLLRRKVLLRVKRAGGEGFYARCDAHCVRTLEGTGMENSTVSSAGCIKVAGELCVGCRLCAKACPVNAVQVQGRSVTIDGALCMGCGACVRKCPKKALAMV